jgi:hypothetical protein
MSEVRRRGVFTPSPDFAHPSNDEPRTDLSWQVQQRKCRMGDRWRALSEAERTTRIIIAATITVVVAWLILTA